MTVVLVVAIVLVAAVCALLAVRQAAVTRENRALLARRSGPDEQEALAARSYLLRLEQQLTTERRRAEELAAGRSDADGQLDALQRSVAALTAERDQAAAAADRSARQLAEQAAGHAEAAGRLGTLDGELDELRRRVDLLGAEREQAVAEARALAVRLDELSESVPPVEDAANPSAPRELPLGRDTAADSVVDGADLGALVVRAASVRGDRHREEKEHRRDCALLRLVDGFGAPVLLSSVAAGAPDGELSQSAATAACRALALQLGHYAPTLRERLFDPRADVELAGTLKVACQGVARSVRLVALGAGAEQADRAAEVGGQADTSLLAVLSELGDRESRRHVAFGVGDGVVLRLRSAQDGWEWQTLFEPAAGARALRLPGSPEGVGWARFDTVPGDTVVVATRPVAELLQRADLAHWFARRWGGRQPYLTAFLSDLNIRVRSTGGDRSLACLWDFGQARIAERAARVGLESGPTR
ncbi:hypothetical protein GCM10009665_23880 [Kitasatospora nipponensis]|uniref:Uncharacterized protein n=1 Tax=Kitasatospora nipponensis TaxID=258049 RepID=A0ABP4GQQ3_9ACTN